MATRHILDVSLPGIPYKIRVSLCEHQTLPLRYLLYTICTRFHYVRRVSFTRANYTVTCVHIIIII